MNIELVNVLKNIRSLSLDISCNYIDYIMKEGERMPDDLETKLYGILSDMKMLESLYDNDYVTLEEYYTIKNRMIADIVVNSENKIKENETKFD